MFLFFSFFFNAPATTEIYTLSLHDALPISPRRRRPAARLFGSTRTSPLRTPTSGRSEEHTSELLSQFHRVCRLLLEKKKRRAHRRPRCILQQPARPTRRIGIAP